MEEGLDSPAGHVDDCKEDLVIVVYDCGLSNISVATHDDEEGKTVKSEWRTRREMP